MINIGALKEKNDGLVEREIADVVRTAHGRGALCKVIIEAGLLDEEEKIRVCFLARKAGADYVKTSTGFTSSGATVKDVALMRQTVGPDMGVKASGGIRSLKEAKDMGQVGSMITAQTGVIGLLRSVAPSVSAEIMAEVSGQ